MGLFKKKNKKKEYKWVYPCVDIIEYLGLTETEYKKLIDTGKVPPKEPPNRMIKDGNYQSRGKVAARKITKKA